MCDGKVSNIHTICTCDVKHKVMYIVSFGLVHFNIHSGSKNFELGRTRHATAPPENKLRAVAAGYAPSDANDDRRAIGHPACRKINSDRVRIKTVATKRKTRTRRFTVTRPTLSCLRYDVTLSLVRSAYVYNALCITNFLTRAIRTRCPSHARSPWTVDAYFIEQWRI